MGFGDEEEVQTQGQIFCLEWVPRSKTAIQVDKIKLSKKELASILAGEAFGSSKKNKSEGEFDATDEEETDEENDDKDEDVNEDAADEDEASEEEEDEDGSDNWEDEEEEATVKEEKATVKKEDLEGLEEFDFDNYDEEGFHVERFSDFYMPFDDENIAEEDDSESDEDEKEDLNFKKDDNLLVCSRCKIGSNCLEVNVYNHETKDFYVHHHIDLYKTLPICLQWMDFDAGYDKNDKNNVSQTSDKGSFIAVGTMQSVIQIWDLTVVNLMNPDFCLGEDMTLPGSSNAECYRTKDTHQGAILDLAWSPYKRKRILSASADRTVALWDIQSERIVRRYRKHKDKVQTIAFRQDSADHLLSGAFNGTIFLFDIRTVCGKEVPNWKLDEEVERVCWNNEDNNYFAASTDQGTIHYFDCRQTGKSLYSWKAHDDAVPALSIRSNSSIYSACNSGLLKSWKLSNTAATLEEETDLKIGTAHCLGFNPDVPSVLVAGGEKQGVRMIDTSQEKKIKEKKKKKKEEKKSEENKSEEKEEGTETSSSVAKKPKKPKKKKTPVNENLNKEKSPTKVPSKKRKLN